ncbi:AAA family ATPase [Microbacterium sp. NPDC058021]|uniref:AAA family ATPase n=1 Tax=Microbacterium sp. NPDC058021 TaxID=3346306 RepID=UPI0036DEE467
MNGTLETTSSALAERFVLGAIMADTRVLRSVQEQVVPRDFEDQRLGAIYAGIIRMVAERMPVDYLTVWDQLAAWDVRGVDLPQLSEWATAVPSTSSAPYYASLVRDAAIRRQLTVIGSRLQSAPDTGVALSTALEDLRALRDRDAASTTSARTLRQVLDVPEEEDAYQWVVPDVLERRDRLMLTGSEGGGKSTFLRQIAVLAAGGIHPFRFSPIDPIRVLVVDAENSERQWRRAVRAMAEEVEMRGQRAPHDHLALEFVPRMDITRAGDLGQLHRRIDETRPDLLLIGPLYRLLPGSINNDDDAAPVLAALDSLRERDVAMLIEAHAGHSVSAGGDRDLRPRGSSALLGWPEFGLGLRRDKQVGAGGQVRFSLVRWRGDRDRRAWPTKLARGHLWPWEPVQV